LLSGLLLRSPAKVVDQLQRKPERKSLVAAKKPCCSDKKAQAACGAAAAVSQDKAEAGATEEGCPDVTGRDALMNFHKNMHPMHVAVKDGNYDSVRELLPALVDASKGVGEYKCQGYDKCTDACRANFDGKKGEFIESVDKLKEACKGKDNEVVESAFNVMHESYIAFANTCSHEMETEVKSEKTQ